MSDSTTQLSKYQRYLPTEPLTSLKSALSYFEAIREVAILIGPVQKIDHLPVGFRIAINIEVPDLTVDAKGQGRDVYRHPVWCGEHERGLSAIFLRKLANAARIDVLESDRVDDQRDPNFCRWSILAAVPQPDGTKLLRRVAKKLDFRPASPETKTFKDAQLVQAQVNIESLAESKCMVRLTKHALALPHKYTVAELQAKPFVVPVLVYEPDMSDPEIRRMAAANYFGSVNLLYGAGKKPASLISGEVVDISGDEDDHDEPQPTAEQAGYSPPKEAAPQPATAISPPLKSPAAEVVSPIAWLPLTQEEIKQAPNDILPGGGTRRAWLDKLSAYASAVIEQHGRQLGGAAIARAIGGIDLATANGGDLSTIGQILRTEMQAGGAA